jgi:hypothetical protein
MKALEFFFFFFFLNESVELHLLFKPLQGPRVGSLVRTPIPWPTHGTPVLINSIIFYSMTASDLLILSLLL